MSSGIEEMEAELNVGGNAWVTGFSLCIAKISQSLRNFRYAHFFAIIAKVTVHRENLNFRYALYFRYDSEIHYAYEIYPPVLLFQTTSFCIIPILSLL